MNYTRIFLAALGAFVIYFVLGGLSFAISSLKDEFLKYPNIYRTQEAMKSVMPIGMIAMFLSMVVLAVLYAMLYKSGSGLAEGARFGVMIGIFADCAFVFHNYVNLQIGMRLTLYGAVAYLIEWTAAGIAIGLIYRPQ